MPEQMIAAVTKDPLETISTQLREPKWLLEFRRHAELAFRALPKEQLKQGIGIVTKPFVYPSEIQTDAMLMESSLPCVYSFSSIFAHKDEKLIKTLQNYVGKSIISDERKEIAFQSAYFTEGLLVIIPREMNLEAPIVLPSMPDSITRVVVVAEPMSSVALIDENRNGIVEVFAQAGSHVNYVSVMNPASGDTRMTFSGKRAQVDQDAQMKWIDIRLGHHNYEKSLTSTHLRGTGSQAHTFDLFFGKNEQNFHIVSDAVHFATHTTSNMTVKGILNDKAKALYRGLIKIMPHATTSNGYQKEDTLLLTDTCEVDPVPSLEILNNDVKCGHGSTTTYIDKEKLFYLMSRGIDEKTGMKQVIQGFVEGVVRELPSEELQQRIRQEISDQLEIKL